MNISFLIFLLFIVTSSFASLSLQQVDNLNLPRSSLGCAAINGTVYAIGGRINFEGQVTDSVEYLLSNGSWAYGPSMLIARSNASFVSYQNRWIFVAGGNIQSSINGTNSVEIFDSVEHTWTEISSLTHSRIGGFAFVTQDLLNATIEYLVIVGGEQDSSSTFEIAVITYSNDNISLSNFTMYPLNPSVAQAMQGSQVQVTSDQIFFIGGIFNYSSTPIVCSISITEFLNVSVPSPRVQNETSLPFARSGLASAVWDGVIYVFGGAAQTTYDTENVTFIKASYENQIVSYNNGIWTVADVNLIRGMSDSCAVSFNDDVYVLGGYTDMWLVNSTSPYNGAVYANVQVLQNPGSDPKKHDGLTTEALAGIVVGSLVGVAIILGIIAFFTRRRKQEQYRQLY